MKRLIFLDTAKAICIILVVVGHFCPKESPDWWIEIVRIIYSFHMPLFLFASGMTYMLTKKTSYFAFLKKKVKRLMVPYFTVSIIIICIKIFTDNFLTVDHPVQIISFLKMFYLPEAGYFLWFVWVLFWSFIIIPFFKTKLSKHLLLALSLLLFLGNFNLPTVFCIKQFGLFFIFFILGAVAYEYKEKLKGLLKLNPLIYIAIFSLLYLIKDENGTTLARIALLAANISGIAMVISVSYYLGKIRLGERQFLAISSASYTIYLLHTTFEGFAKSLFNKFNLSLIPDWIFVMTAFIVIITGTIVPILLHKYVLIKYKTTRLLFGLTHNKR